MIKNKTKAFTLIEILVVLVLISCGLLPIYSLMRHGRQRITRTDSKTLATLFGASALDLARTIGFDRAQKINKDDDFLELQYMADKNGYELVAEPALFNVKPLPEKAKPMELLRVIVKIKAKRKTESEKEAPELVFFTLLSDPRHNFY